VIVAITGHRKLSPADAALVTARVWVETIGGAR